MIYIKLSNVIPINSKLQQIVKILTYDKSQIIKLYKYIKINFKTLEDGLKILKNWFAINSGHQIIPLYLSLLFSKRTNF